MLLEVEPTECFGDRGRPGFEERTRRGINISLDMKADLFVDVEDLGIGHFPDAEEDETEEFPNRAILRDPLPQDYDLIRVNEIDDGMDELVEEARILVIQVLCDSEEGETDLGWNGIFRIPDVGPQVLVAHVLSLQKVCKRNIIF